MGAADFLVTFRAKPGDDQISLFVKQEKTVAVLHDKSISPADRLSGSSRPKGFPDSLACFEFQAAQLAITADTVDMAILNEWRGHHRIEVGRVFLARLFRAPDCFGLW